MIRCCRQVFENEGATSVEIFAHKLRSVVCQEEVLDAIGCRPVVDKRQCRLPTVVFGTDKTSVSFEYLSVVETPNLVRFYIFGNGRNMPIATNSGAGALAWSSLRCRCCP